MTDQARQRKTLGANLIGEVLARRDHAGDAGWTASVRRAITPASEVGAYGATERHLIDIRSDRTKSSVRRAAAICATATGSPQGQGNLGTSLAMLARQENSDGVEGKVTALPLLDPENAAIALSSLIQRCSHYSIPVNFYQLADTLGRWGDGLTPDSRRVRQRLVGEFYSTLE